MELCLRLVKDAGAAATFFVTHRSPVLEELRADPAAIELGIHPNFLESSSHGVGSREILDHCLDIVPEATSMRTHGLVQSSALFVSISDDYPQISTDVSLFLPFHANLQPTSLFLGRSKRRLVRLPYRWADDICADWPGWDWDSEPENAPGLNIFAFHPIHIALNTDSMGRYEELKSLARGTKLGDLPMTAVEPLVNRGAGARTFLERLLGQAGDGGFARLSDISAEATGS